MRWQFSLIIGAVAALSLVAFVLGVTSDRLAHHGSALISVATLCAGVAGICAAVCLVAVLLLPAF